MRKFIILCLLTVIFAVTANAEIEVIKNPLNPKVKQFVAVAEHVYDLPDSIYEVKNYFLANDKIFILDSQAKSVFILFLDCKIIKVLDKTGRGPGEFSLPIRIFNDSKQKYFGVIDAQNWRISYFDYNGNYIIDKLIQNKNLLIARSYIGDYKVSYFIDMLSDQDKKKMQVKLTISLHKYNETVILAENLTNPYKMRIFNSGTPIYINSQQEIYIVILSPKQYLIKVFDREGDHIRVIQKEYKKVKKSKEEIKQIKNLIKTINKQLKSSGKISKVSNYQYKLSINKLLIDEEERLWVLTQDKNGEFFDIIDKSGKIIAQCSNKEKKFKRCRFYKDRLYEIEGNEDEGYKLIVYKIMEN